MSVTAFLMGFLGSFHCVVMCAPIMLSLKWQGIKSLTVLRNKLVYQLGRIITYVLIGVLFYAIGSNAFLGNFQKTTSITIGVVLILSVLFKKQVGQSSNKVVMWFFDNAKRIIEPLTKVKGTVSSFSLGMLNGLLPCGLVYLAAFTAVLQPSVQQNVFYMVSFGMGTLPLILLVIGGIQLKNIKVKTWANQLTPIFIIVLGTYFIFRGLELGIPYLSPVLDLANDSTAVCAPN